MLARRAEQVIVGAAIAVALVALVYTGARTWLPTMDIADVWLRTRDVGGPHTPLVGPESRFGGFHPGPLLYYLFAPLVWMLGGSPSGLLVGTLLVSLCSSVVLVWLTARIAGPAAGMVVAVGTAVLCLGWRDHLIEPWHPHLMVLSFAPFVVAAWLATTGDRVAIVVALVTGSFAAQSHLSSLPPVVIVGATAVIAGMADRFRHDGLRAFRPSIPYVVLLVVLWAPPLAEQLTSRPGNLVKLLRFSLHEGPMPPGEWPRVGWAAGLRVAGGQLVPWGPWLGFESLYALPTPGKWQFGFVVALLAVGGLLARHTRDLLSWRLVIIEGAGVTATLFAAASVRGLMVYYLLLWTRPIAMLLVATPMVVLVRAKPGVLGRITRVLSSATPAAAIAALVSICGMLDALPEAHLGQAHLIASAVALDAAPPGLVRVAGIGPFGTVSPETIVGVFELMRHPAKLAPYYGGAVGEHRIAEPGKKLPTIVFAASVNVNDVPHLDVARRLYFNDPLPAADRQTATTLRTQLEAQLRAVDRRDVMALLDMGVTDVGPAPAGVDASALARYLHLAGGIEKMRFALYLLPPVTW